MSKTILMAMAVAAPLLGACTMSNTDASTAFGAAAGAGIGYLTADALDANDNWTTVATLAGAATGSLVAKNTNSATCAYSNGDGTYYTAPCP
ncbi:glucose-6-phosphate isomerase [Celeribacter litoreus]|uniref:glucose-6-phosphate isomerase n=1 Tax=Celeribacter litoreus TaxID=2876714 RepID=UPI001CCD6B19|nr:glucose-6-phosphate isomerase [Celeribacter litoreus]MCA0044727.1 glucose-6-phosphate isomerase [Celeribacter litoreus]